jgi:hypothetical protein
MELAVYLANLKQVLDLDEVLRPVDCDAIPNFINTIVFSNDNSSREYFANLVGLKWLGQFTERIGATIGRLYFGQEFCEHLVPSAEDLTQAYYYCRQLGWEFTYVTNCCTDEGLARQRESLAFLAEQDDAIEVVVNDWGLFRLMRREFPRLIPVLGRLLDKQKRLGHYTSPKSPPPINRDGLEAPEDELRQAQLEALRDTAFANPEFRTELRELGFARIDLDIVPQGISLPQEPDGLGASCYYPWGYLAGARNCLTAGVVEPAREFVVVDGPCPRPCQRFNKSTVRGSNDEIIIQRGNSVFLFHTEYAAPYMNGQFPIDRVVFEPYIPI